MWVVATRANRRVFWAAIAEGLPTVAASQRARIDPATGRSWFREAGGVPAVETEEPSGRFLSLAEREEIAVGVAAGQSARRIAAALGRASTTVSRELGLWAAAHPGRPYRAVPAQELLRRNLLIYGVGGLIVQFIGIKLIDLALAAMGVH